jgi:hypothetical protein
MNLGPMDPRQHYARSLDSRPQLGHLGNAPWCQWHFAYHQCAHDIVPALPTSALRRYREMHATGEA